MNLRILGQPCEEFYLGGQPVFTTEEAKEEFEEEVAMDELEEHVYRAECKASDRPSFSSLGQRGETVRRPPRVCDRRQTKIVQGWPKLRDLVQIF